MISSTRRLLSQTPRPTESGDMLVLRHKVLTLDHKPRRFRVILHCEKDTYSTPWSDPIVPTLCGNGVVEIGEDCESGLFFYKNNRGALSLPVYFCHHAQQRKTASTACIRSVERMSLLGCPRRG